MRLLFGHLEKRPSAAGRKKGKESVILSPDLPNQ